MGKFLRIALLFVSCIYLSFSAKAQGNVTIRGTVVDDKGLTLPGVTITVKDSRTNAISDVNGRYSITVAPTARTLVFSFVGMERQEVNINGRTEINVNMKVSTRTLNEVSVVSIGYGTQRRQDINGAISSVSAAQIADIPKPSIDQLLQGKAAGVTVVQNSGAPGSATSVHIRGVTSFNAPEPLYVIDGVEVQGSANRNGGSPQLRLNGNEETGVSPLSLINPNDIESIDILKDASAAAIYGSRGSNGVVIITTKHGRAGTSHINYDGFFGVQEQGKFLKMMDLPQYATLENALSKSFRTTPRADFANPSVLGPGTNWQNAIFRRALEQSHNVSVSGANNGTDYYMSGGYFRQQGTILGSSFERYTVRTSVNAQVKPWFRMGTTMGGNRSNQNMGLGQNTGLVYNALLAAPDQPVYNADGSYAGPYVDASGTKYGGPNPVQQALSLTNTLLRNNISGSVYSEIKFFNDLNLRSEVDGDFNWNNAQTFNPTYAYGISGNAIAYTNQTATLSRLISNSSYWSWKEYFNYHHTFAKKHDITALAGREVWENKWDNVSLSGSNFIAGNNIQSIALANNLASSIPESKATSVMESYLARLIYTFNNRYSITANIRSDKSSNFAPGHQVGVFPGASASWRISEEPFMAGTKKYVDNLKLRINYGTTGNSNVGIDPYLASLRPVATQFGTGYIINNVANPNVTWETAIAKGAGLDFSILNNRVDATIDYFDKSSKHFLFQQPLPYFLVGGPNEYGDNPAGINPPYINAGQISNKGIEFTINSRNIVTKDFNWSSNLTFSHYVNKIVSLNNAPEIDRSINTAYISVPATRTVPGYPIGEFYGYKVKGIVKTQADLQYLATHPQNVTGTSPQVVTNDPNVANSIWLGDVMYQDTNGDGKVDANDRVAIGNPNPTFTYGFTNTFNYKDFELSVFIYGSYGGKIMDILETQIAGLSSQYQNQLASVANFWTPQNATSDIPAPRGGLGNPNVVMSDRFIHSASFLRFQNVRLGYNLPQRWAKYVAMSGLKVYVSGQNLFVITKYPGLDPEVGLFNQDPTQMNIDLGRYPSPRVFTFGINAQF